MARRRSGSMLRRLVQVSVAAAGMIPAELPIY